MSHPCMHMCAGLGCVRLRAFAGIERSVEAMGTKMPTTKKESLVGRAHVYAYVHNSVSCFK